MSDKFKFSEEEREKIELWIHVYLSVLFSREDINLFLDRIESIIQDRGNSIQDGWIDVSDPPKEDGSYLMLFGFANPFMYVCHYYTSIGFGPDTLKWQPLPPFPPSLKPKK